MAAPARAVGTGGERITLRLWVMPDGPDPAGAIETEIAAFEAANSGIKVEYEILDWRLALARLTTAAASDEGPDVAQLGTTWVAPLDTAGALAPLEGVDPAAFTPASWNTAVPVGKSSPAAVPWFTDVRAVVYRTDVFQKAGLDADEVFADWDSFAASLRAIKNAGIPNDSGTGPIAPLAFPGKNDWNLPHNFLPWVWSNGGDLLNAGLTASTINAPEAVEAIFFYTNLHSLSLTPGNSPEDNLAEIYTLLRDGDAAMVVTGPWAIANSRTSAERGGWGDRLVARNLAVHEIPNSPATGRHATFVGGSNLALWKSSAHPEEARKLIDFLTSPKSQVRYSLGLGVLPAAVAALADPLIVSDPDYSVFATAVGNGRSFPAIPQWDAVENAFVAALNGLLGDMAAGRITRPGDLRARLDEAANKLGVLLDGFGAGS